MSVGENNQDALLEAFELLKKIEKEDIEIIFDLIEDLISSGELYFHETSEGYKTYISMEKVNDFKNKVNKKLHKYLIYDNIAVFFITLVYYISDKGETELYEMFKEFDEKKSESLVEKAKLVESLMFKKRTIMDYIVNVIFNKLNKIIDIDYEIPLRTLEFKRELEKRNIVSSECDLCIGTYNKKRNKREDLNFSLTYNQIKLFRETLEEIEKEIMNKERLIKEIEKEK